ncbi:N-acetyltransferase family protein [Mycetocola manganoxydans]|uniref:N-acetyltransferase family protein n=1 Tax=Mycetocola manganoxydans TaxID=699879 RepID=A0A3L7A0Q5_9MICO|nr:GNAT family N-acetyltransferase [Mycetocola manganoxydans]RLP73799.1 N-acetyltransferase family protein [Mycetocola manganoxydans]GHD42992.1 N-acetyltransferase [Mycetocola manganoxydans]
MLEEEYQPRRTLPPHLRKKPEPETPFSYTIREAELADLPHIREIYNYYVANSVVTFDEDRMSLAKWKSKFAHLQKLGMPFIVAESPNKVILGYALVSPWKEKRAYRFTVENSIYLGPASTGKGLGRVMLAELIERSKAAGLKEILAVISDKGAEASIALHESFGFAEIGRMGRVGFKFERWLGTVLLQKSLK